MGTNGKRNTESRSSTAVILVHPDAKIPEWVGRSDDARISIGRINGGRTVRRLDIDFAQVNFAEKGSVVLRSSGSSGFQPFLPPGAALAITDRDGNLILNRHTCPRCFGNSGRFKRSEEGRKIFLGEGKEGRIYLFVCHVCSTNWEVPFPPSNGNGNGHHPSHSPEFSYAHVMTAYTREHLDLKPPRRNGR